MLKSLHKDNIILNTHGMASVEAISLLVIFAVMASYSLGTFGIVHSGIINSIYARAYAFETFRNRTNLTYWRDDRAEALSNYSKVGFRVHGIKTENAPDSDKWWATERPLSMGREPQSIGRSQQTHNALENITPVERSQVNPVWIKTVYGICLNSQCKGI